MQTTKIKTRNIKLESCNCYASNLSQSLNSQYIVGQSHIYHTFRHYILLTPLGFLPKWMNKHTPGLCLSWTYWGKKGQIQPCSERRQLENNFKDQMLCKKRYFSACSHRDFTLGVCHPIWIKCIGVLSHEDIESYSLLSASKKPLLGTSLWIKDWESVQIHQNTYYHVPWA